jgi:hypothetical protein
MGAAERMAERLVYKEVKHANVVGDRWGFGDDSETLIVGCAVIERRKQVIKISDWEGHMFKSTPESQESDGYCTTTSFIHNKQKNVFVPQKNLSRRKRKRKKEKGSWKGSSKGDETSSSLDPTVHHSNNLEKTIPAESSVPLLAAGGEWRFAASTISSWRRIVRIADKRIICTDCTSRGPEWDSGCNWDYDLSSRACHGI